MSHLSWKWWLAQQPVSVAGHLQNIGPRASKGCLHRSTTWAGHHSAHCACVRFFSELDHVRTVRSTRVEVVLQLEGVCDCRRGVRQAWLLLQNKGGLVNLFTFWHPVWTCTCFAFLLPWKGIWNRSTKRTLKAAGFTPCSKFQLVCDWELNPCALAQAIRLGSLTCSLDLWGAMARAGKIALSQAPSSTFGLGKPIRTWCRPGQNSGCEWAALAGVPV